MMQAKLRGTGVGWVLGTGIVALSVFGVWITAHATWVAAHRGDTSFAGTFKYPTWSIVHFVPALFFASILPFQLWPGSRRRYPRLHRKAGRMAVLAGFLFALTGLILPFVMPARPFSERAFMTTVSCLFLMLLARGVVAARRRDFTTHRVCMLRVTALSMSPLTDRVIFPFFAAAGIDSLPRFWDLFMTAVWFSMVMNVLIAEWWIRRGIGRAAESRILEPSGIAVAIPSR